MSEPECFTQGDLDWIHFTSVCNLALLGPVSSKVEGLINSEKPVKLIITVILFVLYLQLCHPPDSPVN